MRFASMLVAVVILWGAAIAPAATKDASAEVAFWVSVQKTNEPSELRAYLKAYPDGVFSALARIRLEKLSRNNQPRTLKLVPTTQIQPTLNDDKEDFSKF